MEQSGKIGLLSLAGYMDWFYSLSDENILLLTLDVLYEQGAQ